MASTEHHLEFILEKVAPERLWRMLSTETGLNSWITGRVVFSGDQASFHWSDYECDECRVEVVTPGRQIRFYWLEDEGFLEFSIRYTELTQDATLVISDPTAEEHASSAEIWQPQVARLMHNLGIRGNTY